MSYQILAVAGGIFLKVLFPCSLFISLQKIKIKIKIPAATMYSTGN